MFSKKLSRLKFFNIYLGNLFEHYDTALYSYLSPFFAQIFFPKQDYLLGLIITFALWPIGKLSRPIGSLFFGYIGDNYGREKALFISLFGMGAATFLIGMLPTYDSVKIFAPVCLVLARLSQNFFAAGENIGGAIYILEKIKNDEKKDKASSYFNTSTIAGILLASFIVSIFYHFNIMNAWRILYFWGAITGIFASLIRYKFEKLNFIKTVNKKNISLLKHLKMFWKIRYNAIAIMLAAGFSYATYAMAFVLMNAFVPLISDFSKSALMKINTLLLLFDFLALPFFGSLTKKISRYQMMNLSLIFAIVTGLPLFFLLNKVSFFSVIFVRVIVVISGVWFSATFHSWSQSLVPASHRYTIITFAYSVGAQLFGSTTPMICLWIFKKTQIISSIAWYWIALAIFTNIFLLKTKSYMQNDQKEVKSEI